MAAGRKTGGRVKGTPNKATADLKALAQGFTLECVAALAKALRDPDQAVAAAKILLAYGHGAPRASVDVAMKAVYVIADRPLDANEWAAKYAGGAGPDDPQDRLAAPARPAKRSR